MKYTTWEKKVIKITNKFYIQQLKHANTNGLRKERINLLLGCLVNVSAHDSVTQSVR